MPDHVNYITQTALHILYHAHVLMICTYLYTQGWVCPIFCEQIHEHALRANMVCVKLLILTSHAYTRLARVHAHLTHKLTLSPAYEAVPAYALPHEQASSRTQAYRAPFSAETLALALPRSYRASLCTGNLHSACSRATRATFVAALSLSPSRTHIVRRPTSGGRALMHARRAFFSERRSRSRAHARASRVNPELRKLARKQRMFLGVALPLSHALRASSQE